MILPKCTVCDRKKSKFIKQQEASGLLSNLGIKTPLKRIPSIGPYLFWTQLHWIELNKPIQGIKWMK